MVNAKGRLCTLNALLVILALISLVVSAVPVLAEPGYPLTPADTQVSSALSYLHSQQSSDGGIGGFAPSAWVTMAIVAAGEDPHNWRTDSNPSIVDYLANNAPSVNKTNDYSRMTLAITAAGENPTNFGGVDFVSELKADYVGGQIGDSSLLYDDFWGVMALIAAGESPTSQVVADSVAFIKNNQDSDGGWSWGVGQSTDVDDTAAAIMALISAGESQSSGNITAGLAYIKSTQVDSGGFVSPGLWGADNADTDSWAINAIVAAGQDPTSSSWTESGNTTIDDLL
ncbi:prenyltransferase/squalene oxidase repeat-containing protein, partial [Chloroflexota bacterium]